MAGYRFIFGLNDLHKMVTKRLKSKIISQLDENTKSANFQMFFTQCFPQPLGVGPSPIFYLSKYGEI